MHGIFFYNGKNGRKKNGKGTEKTECKDWSIEWAEDGEKIGKQAEAWKFFLQRKGTEGRKTERDGKDRMQGLEC